MFPFRFILFLVCLPCLGIAFVTTPLAAAQESGRLDELVRRLAWCGELPAAELTELAAGGARAQEALERFRAEGLLEWSDFYRWSNAVDGVVAARRETGLGDPLAAVEAALEASGTASTALASALLILSPVREAAEARLLDAYRRLSRAAGELTFEDAQELHESRYPHQLTYEAHLERQELLTPIYRAVREELHLGERLHFLLDHVLLGLDSIEVTELDRPEDLLEYAAMGPGFDQEDLAFLVSRRTEIAPVLLERLKTRDSSLAAILLALAGERDALPELRRVLLTTTYGYGWESNFPALDWDNNHPRSWAALLAIEALTGAPLPEAIRLTPHELATLEQRFDGASFFVLRRLAPDVARARALRQVRDRRQGSNCFEAASTVFELDYLPIGTTEAELVALLGPSDLLDGSHWLYTCNLENPGLELDLEVIEGRLAAFERRRLDSVRRYPESLTETTLRLLGDLTVPESSHEAARTLLRGSRALELAAPDLVPVVRDGWVKALGAPDAELRCVAAKGLGALVAGALDESSRSALLSLAQTDERCGREAALALAHHGVTPADSPEPEIRRRAIELVGAQEREAKGAAAQLVDALRDGEASVRAAALRALARVDPNAEIFRTSVEWLSDGHPEIRRAAAQVLASPELRRSAEDLRARGEVVESVLVTAAAALDAPEPAVRTAVIQVFETLGEAEETVALLVEVLADPSPSVRHAAARSLAASFAVTGSVDEDTLRALSEALDDEDPSVTEACARALASIGPPARAAVPRLAARLASHGASDPSSTTDALRAALASIERPACGERPRPW